LTVEGGDGDETIRPRRAGRAAIDVEHCPNCGGSLQIIACPEPSRRAATKDPPVIEKILSHLGLPTRAPPRATTGEAVLP